ncbi:hypothetical protein [Streptomyces sp. cmx-4-7]
MEDAQVESVGTPRATGAQAVIADLADAPAIRRAADGAQEGPTA